MTSFLTRATAVLSSRLGVRPYGAGSPPVEEPPDVLTLTFSRGEQRLTIRRPTSTTLVLTGLPGAHRRVSFHTLVDLVTFQGEFEKRLIQTKWTLVAFAPERRVAVSRAAKPPLRWFPPFRRGEERRASTELLSRIPVHI